MLARPLAALAIAAAFTAPAPSARADVVLDTLPGHPQFYTAVSTSQALAVPFTPSIASRLRTVEVALGSCGSATVQVNAAIHAESGGPGAKLADLTSLSVNASITYTALPVGAVDLLAGQQYWLVLTLRPNQADCARWFDSTSATGSVANSIGGQPWTVYSNVVPPAVRINVDSVIACCNPASGQCAIVPLASCQNAGTVGLVAVGAACSPAACHAPCGADFNRSGAATVQDVFDFLAAYFTGCP